MRTSRRSERIVVDAAAFRIEGRGRAALDVAISDIARIIAYKRHMATVDLICFDIEVGAPGESIVYCVHEELEGFDELVARLESLEGFYVKWRDSVVQPPFAENRTPVYVRP
jgi:hypothetical protein